MGIESSILEGIFDGKVWGSRQHNVLLAKLRIYVAQREKKEVSFYYTINYIPSFESVPIMNVINSVHHKIRTLSACDGMY